MASGKYADWLTTDGLLRIEGWARDGLTDEQIAKDKIGIGMTTYYRWQIEHREFREALKRGKAPVDTVVENSLLDSATGFWKTIKEPIKVKTKRQLAGKGTIEEEHIEFVEREVYFPPNVSAQIFWLKNRRPDKWRDRPETIRQESVAGEDPCLAVLEQIRGAMNDAEQR